MTSREILLRVLLKNRQNSEIWKKSLGQKVIFWKSVMQFI